MIEFYILAGVIIAIFVCLAILCFAVAGYLQILSKTPTHPIEPHAFADCPCDDCVDARFITWKREYND